MKNVIRISLLLSATLPFTHCGAIDPDTSVAVEIDIARGDHQQTRPRSIRAGLCLGEMR